MQDKEDKEIWKYIERYDFIGPIENAEKVGVQNIETSVYKKNEEKRKDKERNNNGIGRCWDVQRKEVGIEWVVQSLL